MDKKKGTKGNIEDLRATKAIPRFDYLDYVTSGDRLEAFLRDILNMIGATSDPYFEPMSGNLGLSDNSLQMRHFLSRFQGDPPNRMDSLRPNSLNLNRGQMFGREIDPTPLNALRQILNLAAIDRQDKWDKVREFGSGSFMDFF